MRFLTDTYKGQTIALDIEAAEIDAPNFSQRLKRKKFYARNGFESSGYGYQYENISYEVLKKGDDFKAMELTRLIGRLSLGALQLKFHPFL